MGVFFEVKAGRPGSGWDVVKAFLNGVGAVADEGYWHWTAGEYACRLKAGVCHVEIGVAHITSYGVTWTSSIERLCDAELVNGDLRFGGAASVERHKKKERSAALAAAKKERAELKAQMSQMVAEVRRLTNLLG